MAESPTNAGENSIPIICRPTLPTDREQVLELSSHIWDGQDYIAHVWDAWLAEPLLRLNFGMIDLSWCWGRPRREHLEAEAREGQTWWWHGRRNRRGLLTMWKDYSSVEERQAQLGSLACSEADLAEAKSVELCPSHPFSCSRHRSAVMSIVIS